VSTSSENITAQKDGITVRINTADVYADEITPTTRKSNVATSINNKTGGNIRLISKGAGLGNLPIIIK